MKSLSLLLPLLCSTSAHAKEVLHTFLRPVTGFINHVDSSELRFFDETGLSDTVKIPTQPGASFQIKPSTTYTILNKNLCTPNSQNPMSMGDLGGLILAYPYLVGVDRVCIIDETKKQIRLLATLTASPGDFFVSFAGAYSGRYHFVINGRDMNDPVGYLKRFSIDTNTHRVVDRIVLPLALPDYSGPMIFSKGDVFVTMWVGVDEGQNVTKISQAAIASLLPGELVENNSDYIKSTPMKSFTGQSQLLLLNDLEAFFFNGLDQNIGSYSVTRRTNSKSTEFIPTCTPVQGYKDLWISYCAKGKTLELRSTAELMVR